MTLGGGWLLLPSCISSSSFSSLTNELDARPPAHVSEVGVLGKEAVARVQRLRTRPLGGLQDLLLDQVTLRGGRWPDAVRLIRLMDTGVTGNGSSEGPVWCAE